ncbi:MAG: hypothetical protein KIT72_05775 [Polyangiaceae bacterium]|nr:hypothetical protein [Polyangiaceae bacterium]MCW5789909.1 hypothetical protein [Polyangiaceae bacterium]
MSRTARALRRAASDVQARLAGYYQLEPGVPVADYVLPTAPGSRETLLVRQVGDHLELRLLLPKDVSLGPELHRAQPTDGFLQLVEGVSHFMLVVERARRGLPTTQLELELQAEVDKFALLGGELPPHAGRHIHQRLYEQVSFLHHAGSEQGARYRLANGLAARFVHRLIGRRPALKRRALQRFHGAGQAEKLWLVARGT